MLKYRPGAKDRWRRLSSPLRVHLSAKALLASSCAPVGEGSPSLFVCTCRRRLSSSLRVHLSAKALLASSRAPVVHSWGRNTAQEIAKLFNNCHQAAFTGGSGEACCCSFYGTVDAYQTFLNRRTLRHHCSARANTPRFVMTRCSSSFTFCNPSYTTSNSIHIQSSFTIHFE